MDNKNPLSPHIQIYSWNISSLISISHRIIGVINIIILTIVCFWIASMLLGSVSYEFIYSILNDLKLRKIRNNILSEVLPVKI